jgi:hypothetical protein
LDSTPIHLPSLKDRGFHSAPARSSLYSLSGPVVSLLLILPTEPLDPVEKQLTLLVIQKLVVEAIDCFLEGVRSGDP